MKYKVLITALALCFSATAKEINESEYKPIYIEESSFHVEKEIPPPPARHSKQDEADYERLLKIQDLRTKEDCARAASEVKANVLNLYGPPYGPLTTLEADRLMPFFEKIREEVHYFTHKVKDHWGRQRPYDAEKKVHPCTPLEKSLAYPSGHASLAEVFAKTLIEIYPERKKAISERANQIGDDRILAGVHHPTDVLMGTALGDNLFADFMKNADFIKELNAVKASTQKNTGTK